MKSAAGPNGSDARAIFDTEAIAMAIQNGAVVSVFERNYYNADAWLYRFRQIPENERSLEVRITVVLLHMQVKIQQLNMEKKGRCLVFHNVDSSLMSSLGTRDVETLRLEYAELKRLLRPMEPAKDEKLQDEFFGDLVLRTREYARFRNLQNRFVVEGRPPANRPIEDLYKYVWVLDGKRKEPRKSWRELCAAVQVEYKPNSIRSQISRIRRTLAKYSIPCPVE